jgi:predicted P-loop ATPase
MWLEGPVCNIPKVTQDSLLDALNVVAVNNAFDPLNEYLVALEWDGVNRTDTWLKDYAGAVGDAEYLRAVGRKMLLGMVTRAFEPGTKFDHMMILEGLQGAGKSTFARTLSKPWFSDVDVKLGNKDTIQLLQGCWVVELGELASLKRNEIEEMKKFITQTHDEIRLPYARLTKSFPRRFVMIGTTNAEEYLKDSTGNRRFWPVLCKNEIDNIGLEKIRDQLFAEVVQMYIEGSEKLYLETQELQNLATEVQGSKNVQDPIIEDVQRVLEGLEIGEYSVREVWDRLNPLVARHPDSWEISRIGQALSGLGIETERRRVGGVRGRYFFKL